MAEGRIRLSGKKEKEIRVERERESKNEGNEE